MNGTRLVMVTAPGVFNGAFASDIRSGLSRRPRAIPCRYFYDAEGSRLFESICDLPEYYLTRCEREILQAHAPAILEAAAWPRTLVELGCGSASKTGILLDALAADPAPMRYVAVDISCQALEGAALRLLERYGNLEIHALAGEYHDGLARLAEHSRPPRLILWMGSNVGNLDRDEAAEFLRVLRERMEATDSLLLGVDMRKDAAVLHAAYNDGQGVTARFNLNVLERINRDLGGRFPLEEFEHRAEWQEGPGRIEMLLVNKRRQLVAIEGIDLEVDLEDGERIHTEYSYKYSPEELDVLFAACGMRAAGQWTDARAWFTVTLLRLPGGP